MQERRFFFTPNALEQKELPKEEALHALKVLRLNIGDEIFLMDGNGIFYRAFITQTLQKSCAYEIKETLPQEKAWNNNLHIAIAPTKMMDRIEWFVEKATEIGIDNISFLNCRFSERKVIKTERIEKIIISAIKQSHNAFKPSLYPLISFKDFVHKSIKGKKFIAHCYKEIERKDFFNEIFSTVNNKKEDITILIGPEGDFSLEEVKLAIDNGYTSISLGNSRLRTETAALYAQMMAHLVLRK